jgi:hypothetical protein
MTTFHPASVSEPVNAAVLSHGELYGFEAHYKPRADLLSKQQRRRRNV